MKKNYLFLLLIILVGFSCKTEKKKVKKEYFTTYAESNIFLDDKLREITDYQYTQNVSDLIDNIETVGKFAPKYRKAALVAFGTIQDTLTVTVISSFLEDEDQDVRIAAIFALGQMKNCQTAENILIHYFAKETAPEVKAKIPEAIGKCGSFKGLEFILSLNINSDDLLRESVSQAISRFSERGISSSNSIKTTIDILNDNDSSNKTKLAISYAFARLAPEVNLQPNTLINIYKNCGFLYTKINVLKAIENLKSEEVLKFLIQELNVKSTDYRLKIGMLQALYNYSYSKVKKLFLNFSENKNIHIATVATTFFTKDGVPKDANLYFEQGKKAEQYQIRTQYFAAALKYSTNKTEISKAILAGYTVANNLYEKADLLRALAGSPNYYKQVGKETFATTEPVVRTAGIETLTKMRADSLFDKYAKNQRTITGENVYLAFAKLFKDAVLSGDVSLISIAAQAIRVPSYNFRDLYKNTYFLTQAMNACLLPRDIEAYYELIKTSEYINGALPKGTNIPTITYREIDWELVKSIPEDQKVRFTTEKGKFVVQLDVNNAPASVSTFVQLILDGFYDNKVIHRAVPNFVIQDGCPRGDGWGSPSFVIRSEFAIKKFDEGSVGLASAGKDTESSQWFITHVPTPHLDGKYSNFGLVISGMDVVHKLTVGNKIIKVDIL